MRLSSGVAVAGVYWVIRRKCWQEIFHRLLRYAKLK